MLSRLIPLTMMLANFPIMPVVHNGKYEGSEPPRDKDGFYTDSRGRKYHRDYKTGQVRRVYS